MMTAMLALRRRVSTSLPLFVTRQQQKIFFSTKSDDDSDKKKPQFFSANVSTQQEATFSCIVDIIEKGIWRTSQSR
jgi:hypothetical protein